MCWRRPCSGAPDPQRSRGGLSGGASAAGAGSSHAINRANTIRPSSNGSTGWLGLSGGDATWLKAAKIFKCVTPLRCDTGASLSRSLRSDLIQMRGPSTDEHGKCHLNLRSNGPSALETRRHGCAVEAGGPLRKRPRSPAFE